MKKKGFTLVELLAVIIILAVIALIATPIVLNVVESSKEQGRLQSVNGLIDAAKLYVAEAMLNDNISLAGNILEPVQERTDGRKPESGEIYYDKDLGLGVAVEYDGYCYIQNYYDSVPSKVDTNDCFVFSIVEDVCHEVDVAESYEINYDVCMAAFTGMSSDYTEEDISSICTGGSASDGMSISLALELDYINYKDLEEYGILYDVTTKKECRSCFEYELLEDGTAKITGYNCVEDNKHSLPTITNIAIPTKINDHFVKQIGNRAFINKGITSVDFSGMSELEKIEEYAFYENEISNLNLNKLVNLDTIETFAFAHNEIDGEIDLSNTKLETITTYAFYQNYIESVIFPSTLESILSLSFGENQISGELDLSQYTNLKNMGGFEYNQITSVKLPESVETISGLYNNAISGELDLSYLANLKSVSGFNDNQITSVKFHENITKITGFGDNQITGELDLTYLPNLESVGGFYRNQITSVKLPEGLTTLDISAFSNNALTEVELPNTLTSIGQSAFFGNSLSSIDLPVSVSYMGHAAFQGNLFESIDLSHLTNLKEIPGQLFHDNKLGEIKISNSVETIGRHAFSPGSIATYAVLDLSNATSLTKIDEYAFYFLPITELKLPNSIKEIGDYAFWCFYIEGELDLSSTSLETIGSKAFGRWEIESVKLPTTIKTIGSQAFLKTNDTIFSNRELIKIVNPSGNVFDWTDITGSTTTGQSFATGTITHQLGDITVTAE